MLRFRSAAVLVLATFINACSAHVPERRAIAIDNMANVPFPVDSVIKVHHRSGDLTLLTHWTRDGGAINGDGKRYDIHRDVVATGAMRIPLDSIALIEATQNVSKPSFGNGLSNTWIVLYGVATMLCAMDPKSCFGSCPTFYLDDISRDRPRAEGFSSSIARSLEATDLDDLGAIRGGGAHIDLRMTNEAWETHAIRSVNLMVVPVERGTTQFATATGQFFNVRSPGAPSQCNSSTGDCLAKVAVRDTLEWHGVTDSLDLAARDTMVITFPHRDGKLGLALGARQTFVSTYVLYQTMAYLGREAGNWLTRLELGDSSAHAPLAAVNHLIGEVRIEVANARGEWIDAGVYAEAGPIATDVQLMPLPDGLQGSDVRVRLTFAKGGWRIGYAALATIGAPVGAVRLAPRAVKRLTGKRGDAHAEPDDSTGYLYSYPDDEFMYSFELPRAAEKYALFLESRGWYYEWMRGEWLAEESPLMSAMLMLNPRQAMRVMAPGYKQREAKYETVFWNSKFGRR